MTVSFKPPWCYVTARRAYGCYVSTHVRICFCWHVNQCVWDHDKRIKSSQRIVCVCTDAIVWFLHFSWRCLRTLSHSCWIFFQESRVCWQLEGKVPKTNAVHPATTHTYTHTTHSSSVTLTIHIRHWPPASPPLPPFAPRIKSNTPKITWWVIRVSRALVQPALLIETKGNYLGIPKS